VKIKDIAWLAGMLEGEGWFGTYGNGAVPSIHVGMVDEDIIRRLAETFGRNCSAHKRSAKNIKHKDAWYTYVHGADAAAIMMTIYPFMGERRRSKIHDILTKWLAYPTTNRLGMRRSICVNGHPLTEGNYYIRKKTNSKNPYKVCLVCYRSKLKHPERSVYAGEKQ
jgi:hypothetical protein